MNNFFIKLKENKLFFGLFVGAILIVGMVYSLLPHYIGYSTLSDKGIRYIALTQESKFDFANVQGGRFREILDGRILSGEVDTYEHEGGPSLWPILSATMVAPFLLLTGSITAMFVITDFLFPILIFVSFFLLLFALTRHKFFSLFSSYILMLFPQLPLLIPPSSLIELKILFLQLLPVPLSVPTMDLTYLGRESFIPGGPFFILALYFIYEAVVRESGRKYYILLAGIFYGLLFYLYLYFWVFTTIFLGIYFLTLLVASKRQEAIHIFYVGITGLIVSIPFWFSHHELTQLPNYEELIERMSVEIGHGIKWFLWKTYVLFVAMAGVAYWLGKKLNKMSWSYFIAALALSGVAVYNINVITGFFVQSDHWSGRVFLITEGIIWVVLLYYFIIFLTKKYPTKETLLKKTIVGFFVVLSLSLTSNIIYSQIIQNTNKAKTHTMPAALLESFEWLNENTPTGSVIMSPSLETNIDFSVFTHHKLFLARSQSTLAPESELLNRLYITYKLYGVTSEDLDDMLQSFKGIFYFFTAKYNSRAIDAALRPYKYPMYKLPNELREKILNEYVNFKVPEKLPYRLDYIFVGSKEKEISGNRSFLEQYDKLYDSGGIAIYKYDE